MNIHRRNFRNILVMQVFWGNLSEQVINTFLTFINSIWNICVSSPKAGCDVEGAIWIGCWENIGLSHWLRSCRVVRRLRRHTCMHLCDFSPVCFFQRIPQGIWWKCTVEKSHTIHDTLACDKSTGSSTGWIPVRLNLRDILHILSHANNTCIALDPLLRRCQKA